MTRSILAGLVLAVGVGMPAAWAAPAIPTVGPPVATPVQYYGCPPGYKVTSHGGCKLSHYLRHHPAQNPNNYYNDYNAPPRYRDGYDAPPPRYYYDNGYDDGD